MKRRCSRCRVEKDTHEYAVDEAIVCLDCVIRRLDQIESGERAKGSGAHARSTPAARARNAAKALARKVAQAGRPPPPACEICGETTKVVFDHDHASGLFRGWLCGRCNVTLGFVRDSPDLLSRMIAYLQNGGTRV